VFRFDATKVKVTLYPGEPDLYVTDPNGPVVRDLERRMTRVQWEARRRVRVRTGTLLSTIRKKVGFRKSFAYVDVLAGQNRLRYTMIEHDGSPAHRITARRRKSLRFVVGGRVVFRRSVWHPGTQGTEFLTRALPYASK
jgi:hypothetical protein